MRPRPYCGPAGVSGGALALQLARRDALIFGDLEGRLRDPEHISRQFSRDVARCDGLPPIRLHDLRHTHATILLTAREPVHVVSQRLGHASAVVTMSVYAHVLPGSQREAANLFARLVGRREHDREAAGIRTASRGRRAGNYRLLTCGNVVSEGDLNRSPMSRRRARIPG